VCEEKSAEIGREEIAEAVNFVGSQHPPLSVANYTKKADGEQAAESGKNVTK